MTADAKAIYKALAQIGVKPAQARRLLPSWWDPAIETSSGGVSELAMLLARRLSLDVAALLHGEVAHRGAAHAIAYKHQGGLDASALTGASSVAASLAQAVAAAMTVSYRPPEPSAEAWRAAACSKETRAVTFTALLRTCWSSGIPVIPLPHLPVGMRKMDGAVLGLDDRPAIVVAKRRPSRAWLSFILAHEIGHIVRGHVQPGHSIVDVSLQDTATYATESQRDDQEAQADAFALALLGGPDAEGIVRALPGRLSPVEIAVAARREGLRHDIDAGHLVLRYAFAKRQWADAIQALRFLKEDVDADKALVEAMSQHMDLDAIADDMRDLVTQVTGLASVD